MEGSTLKRLKQRKDLIYFGPGLHRLPGDTLNVPSGTTVYVAGGAVVRGCIRAVNVRDVKIMGRGKVHPQGRGEGIYIMNSKNVRVEGLITTQCPTGGSDSVTIRNVKVISHVTYAHNSGIRRHIYGKSALSIPYSPLMDYYFYTSANGERAYSCV